MNILKLERFYEFLERVLGEVHIFKHRLQISALEQARVLILGKYVLLEVLNTIYKHCLASAIFVIFVKCENRKIGLINGMLYRGYNISCNLVFIYLGDRIFKRFV